MASLTSFKLQRVALSTGKEKYKQVKCIWTGTDGKTYGTITDNGSHYMIHQRDNLWKQVSSEHDQTLDNIERDWI